MPKHIRKGKKKTRANVTFSSIVIDSSYTLKIQDSSQSVLSDRFLIHDRNIDPRAKNTVKARLFQQFININKPLLNMFDLSAYPIFDGDNFDVKIESKSKIGALPLISPITYKPDYSLIISPRFGWDGIGPILSNTGWRITPDILGLPQLKVSEKSIPPWVLSSIVLRRIEALIKKIDRRFEFVEEDRQVPRGQIKWDQYATKKIQTAGFLNFPCRYPDLENNRDLKSIIHFTLDKQLQSLSTQREHGYYVLQLMDFCQHLIQSVKLNAPVRPSQRALNAFQRILFSGETYIKGLDAIDWTVNEKGLAGIGDMKGIPWQMSMETLFEAYIEACLSKLIKEVGGTLKTGRKRETITAVSWEPGFTGSQRFLLPDMVIERDGQHIIVDAKYKDHWEDLNIEGWHNLEQEIRERHRVDLFQILAYASMADHRNITCCLVYPCKAETFNSLSKRNRVTHKASLAMNDRVISLRLTALPLNLSLSDAAATLRSAIVN